MTHTALHYNLSQDERVMSAYLGITKAGSFVRACDTVLATERLD